jgi:Uma2 family endonuclease
MQTIPQPITAPRPIVQPNATWDDYLTWRDNDDVNKIAFHQLNPQQSWLWIDMGKEGPNHARFGDLLTAIFFIWAMVHPEETIDSFGRCLLEKPNTQVCAPDLVIYKGEHIPNWQPGQPRRIDLSRDRIPDLVGEISDTTLSQDLDEQKHLYASLGIPEYWVIATKSAQVFAFTLTASGQYKPCDTSKILTGLSIDLIEQTLDRLSRSTNTAAANWFMQQLQKN